ncbi:CHAD domain-containing protein [Kineococcus sp. LSe6-4]|uniref:CHAD domain-containing protein n=1 Tax=Kineococcus halophytocola TaxID=3234027 RepID=A0ABV4H4M7_9ACTN
MVTQHGEHGEPGQVHEEVEVKYDLAPDAEAPTLGALLGDLPGADERGYREGDPVEHELEAVYFDTRDLRLSAARTTLRRRTGGHDAGWHLKTPWREGARQERHLPLGRAVKTVPAPLRRLVADVTGDQTLVPVARITTHRTVRTLVDAAGTALVELADDRVRAQRLAGGSVGQDEQEWREVELELLDGDRELFDAVDAHLRAAGLVVAETGSKVARVLAGAPAPRTDDAPAAGADAPRPDAPRPADRVLTPAAPRRTDLGPGSRAGDVLVAHLAEQVQRVLDQDPLVRADAPDSVHAMRVATRRLRSALKTYGPLLATSTKPVRAELRRLAAELGEARDAEVLRDRLVRSVASLDADHHDHSADHADQHGAAPDGVPQRVREQLEGDYRTAHDRVLAELDSERHQSLLDALQDLVERPEFSARGRRKAAKVLPKRVAKTFGALADLVQQAQDTGPGPARDELLHEARKAAKQTRYAAEAVVVVFGKDAKRFAKAVTELQEVLGEHQDSVVTRQRLRDLAATAHPEVAFAYGRLFAQEEVHAAATEADVEEVWAAARAKRLHRWLR